MKTWNNSNQKLVYMYMISLPLRSMSQMVEKLACPEMWISEFFNRLRHRAKIGILAQERYNDTNNSSICLNKRAARNFKLRSGSTTQNNALYAQAPL